MGKIVILDEITSNQIAAGEVVERPASVIKEMVENSIDAGASSISVEIKNGGITFMKVTDNGSGLDEDDVEIAFERHATSKIRSANDLESISTMGFRGEALASIASVSTVELTTRMQDKPHGTYINIEGGVTKEIRQVGCPVGTTFVVRNLFYNTPARFKFLKKDSTEAGYISDIMGRIALAKPEISFRLISNNATVLHTPGNNDLLSAIYSVYGKETARQVCEINHEDGRIKISGYAGKPEIARANRNQQSIFVNGRYVKSKIISSAIDEAYKTFLMKNKFPFIILHITVNPVLIDVNVHPTKMEVRFSEEQEIFRSVYHVVVNAVLGNKEVKSVQLGERDRSVFKFENNQMPKTSYSQQNISTHETFTQTRENRMLPEKSLFNRVPREEKGIEAAQSALREEPRLETRDMLSDSVQKTVVPKPDIASTITEETKKEAEGLPETPLKADVVKYEEKLMEDVPVVREVCGDEAGELVEEKNDIPRVQPPENILANSRLIGQVFSTYILLQHENEMILIDQHAAHERVMFEKLREKYRNNESLAQMLLAPMVIELTNKEIKFLETESEFFTKLGFIYEDFGNNCIIVRAVPSIIDSSTVKQSFLDIIDTVMNAGTADFRAIADETLYTIACKAAVKANKKLGELEIQNLLAELTAMENPYTCPHGRPTILKITKYEIEKMFKRIV